MLVQYDPLFGSGGLAAMGSQRAGASDAESLLKTAQTAGVSESPIEIEPPATAPEDNCAISPRTIWGSDLVCGPTQ